MLKEIVEAITALVVLGIFVWMFLGILSPFGILWLWPSRPPREERSERVIIVNNTPPAPAQPAGPGAGSLLALAVAALVVALTRRVESQPALPSGEPPTLTAEDGWIEIEPGRYVRTRATTALARRGYDDYRG